MTQQFLYTCPKNDLIFKKSFKVKIKIKNREIHAHVHQKLCAAKVTASLFIVVPEQVASQMFITAEKV